MMDLYPKFNEKCKQCGEPADILVVVHTAGTRQDAIPMWVCNTCLKNKQKKMVEDFDRRKNN